MSGVPFNTITGDDWKRSLAAARRRRAEQSKLIAAMLPHSPPARFEIVISDVVLAKSHAIPAVALLRVIRDAGYPIQIPSELTVPQPSSVRTHLIKHALASGGITRLDTFQDPQHLTTRYTVWPAPPK